MARADIQVGPPMKRRIFLAVIPDARRNGSPLVAAAWSEVAIEQRLSSRAGVTRSTALGSPGYSSATESKAEAADGI